MKFNLDYNMEVKAMKSKKRFLVLIILFLSWVLGNFDKIAITVAAIPITKEFSLSPQQMGLIMSSFYLSYSIMTLLGGVLADKFGHRRVLMTIMVLWSGFTALTSAAWNLSSMVVIRFLFGAAEGGFSPASSVTIAEVFPKEERGRAKSFLVSASVLGMALGGLVTAAIVTKYNWHMAFILFGILGAILSVLFYMFIREHKGDAAAAQTGNKISLKQAFATPLVFQLGLIYFGAGITNYGLSSWLPSYWVNVRGLSMMEMGAMTAVPFVFMFLSMQVSGYVLDKFLVGREKFAILGGALGVALFMFFVMNATTTLEAVIYLSLTYTSMSFISATVFVLPLKYLPMQMIGSATGFINFMQQAAGVVAPATMGFLITRYAGSYTPVFLFVIAIILVSAAVSLLIKTKTDSQKA
jgi:MFS family permease